MKNKKLIIGIVIGVLVLIGIMAALFLNNRQSAVPNIPKTPPEDINVYFGEVFTLNMKQTAIIKMKQPAIFNDDLKVTLVSSSDSRCPKDAQCIWQGEISYTFDVNGREIKLGTVNDKAEFVETFSIELIGSNESTDKVKIRVDFIEE